MVNRLLKIIVFIVVIATGSVALGSNEKSVSRFLFFPFDGSSAGRYTYLADGIHSMLASRLASKSGIQLVDYAGHEAELRNLEATVADGQPAMAVFEKLQADYLVSGAVYATDAGLKVQVVVSSAVNPGNPYNFSGVAENEEQIIAVVGSIAEDIAGKVVFAPQTDKSLPAVRQGGEGMAGFRTEHPERQYKRGMFGGGAIVSSEGSAIEASSEGIKRSATIPVLVRAMDTGDIDGDGQVEIVFASKTELQIFKYRGGRFQKIGSHALRPTFKIHAITAVDMDKNGKAEIYVSANERHRVASMILQWSPAGDIAVVQENIPWFLRPMVVPGKGLILVGQMSGDDSGRGFVRPGLYRLERTNNGKLTRGEKLPVPAKFNLFDVVWADLEGDKTAELVAIDRNEKLLVYDSSMNLVFVSDGAYGGSTNYMGPDRLDNNKNNPGANVSGEDSDRDLAFVPTRLLAQDVDGDGRQEIIIGKNKRVTPLFLRNFREYEGGTIACLGWRESILKEMWRTNTIPGYIADYSFELLPGKVDTADAGKRAQLYVGQVPGDTFLGLIASKESKMLVYAVKLSGE